METINNEEETLVTQIHVHNEIALASILEAGLLLCLMAVLIAGIRLLWNLN